MGFRIVKKILTSSDIQGSKIRVKPWKLKSKYGTRDEVYRSLDILQHHVIAVKGQGQTLKSLKPSVLKTTWDREMVYLEVKSGVIYIWAFEWLFSTSRFQVFWIFHEISHKKRFHKKNVKPHRVSRGGTNNFERNGGQGIIFYPIFWSDNLLFTRH